MKGEGHRLVARPVTQTDRFKVFGSGNKAIHALLLFPKCRRAAMRGGEVMDFEKAGCSVGRRNDFFRICDPAGKQLFPTR